QALTVFLCALSESPYFLNSLRRRDHVIWTYFLVELFVRQIDTINSFFTQGSAVRVCVLVDFGDGVIAQLCVQRGDQHQRVFEAVLDVVFARLNADDAVVGEADGRIGNQTDRLQEVVGHDRIIDVQLEMALRASERQGGVVAEHLSANLPQGFTLGRVDLARHDRRTRLVFRQRQLAQTCARTRTEEADVVGDLEQRRGNRVDRAVREDHGVVSGQCLELVRGGGEAQAGDLGDVLGNL